LLTNQETDSCKIWGEDIITSTKTEPCEMPAVAASPLPTNFPLLSAFLPFHWSYTTTSSKKHTPTATFQMG
jgi:hypothetical protein